MVPPFVKKFDFRGIYNKDITNADGYYLGLALAKVMPLKKVLIGWDTRDSSKHLAFHFMTAMVESNVRISYMDKCPIDYVTAGANAFEFDLSIMFTGSHNPWDWTGLLMHTKGGESIQGELVDKIVEQYYEVAKQHSDYNDKVDAINLADFNDFYQVLEEAYTAKLKSLISLDQIKPAKVLVDVGDGSGSRSLTLLEKLLPQVTFSRIHDREIYNASSSHVADPSQIGTMKELMTKLSQGGYDAGFAFDSDADRVLGVDEKGGYLNGSLLGAAMAECFIKQGFPDKLFGYSVDCGPSMYNAVKPIGNIKPLPVGRSLMRTMLREGTLDFGVENVGHFYTKDFFMTDSGAFSLVVVLYWMSLNGALSSLNEKHPDGNRQHFFMPVDPNDDDNAAYLYEQINKRYKDNKSEKKIDVDGLRYEFFEDNKMVSWYAMRKSGYEAVEKYYMGSLDEKEFTKLKGAFEELFEKKRK